MIHLTFTTRFWSKVNKHGPIHPVLRTRCWLWTAKTVIGGYGHFRVGDTHKLAHRVAWFLTYGKWPESNCLHKCDNPPCCNPDHLFEGNDRDNATDKMKKGRLKCGHNFGETNGRTKLKKVDVLHILAEHATGKVTQASLAKQFKVDPSQISHIVNGQHWGHL